MLVQKEPRHHEDGRERPVRGLLGAGGGLQGRGEDRGQGHQPGVRAVYLWQHGVIFKSTYSFRKYWDIFRQPTNSIHFSRAIALQVYFIFVRKLERHEVFIMKHVYLFKISTHQKCHNSWVVFKLPAKLARSNETNQLWQLIQNNAEEVEEVSSILASTTRLSIMRQLSGNHCFAMRGSPASPDQLGSGGEGQGGVLKHGKEGPRGRWRRGISQWKKRGHPWGVEVFTIPLWTRLSLSLANFRRKGELSLLVCDLLWVFVSHKSDTMWSGRNAETCYGCLRGENIYKTWGSVFWEGLGRNRERYFSFSVHSTGNCMINLTLLALMGRVKLLWSNLLLPLDSQSVSRPRLPPIIKI